MITMEKIDYVMDVTNTQYEVVRKALLDSDGDVDKAIELIRNSVDVNKETSGNKRQNFKDFDDVNFDDIKRKLLEIWEEGNANRLIIKKGNNVILNLSLATSAFAAIINPVVAFLGAGAGLINDYDFLISMKNGEEIDLRRYILKNSTKFF